MTLLALAQIRRDGGTQTRWELDQDAVRDYTDRYRDELEMPPVVVYFDGADHWLADGFHRVTAAELAGRGEIPTEVRSGTLADARRHAIGANEVHGVRLKTIDRRRKVRMALADSELADLSDRELGRRCGVDHKTVASVRAEADPPWARIRRERLELISQRRPLHDELVARSADSDDPKRTFLYLWDVFRGRAWEHEWCRTGRVGAAFALRATQDYEQRAQEARASGREADDEVREYVGDYLIPGAMLLAEATLAIRAALIPEWWAWFEARAELLAEPDHDAWNRIASVAVLIQAEQRAALRGAS